MTAYTVSSDADPCTYTFCKSNSDVCKLRIDYETMNIAGPVTYTTAAPYATTLNYKLGWELGDCNTDTMTVSNPGGSSPPVICGYNTGQHMWVPASDSCNMINFDIDTGSTGTTRTWQIKVTQFECNDLKAPEQDCLQWHTAEYGTIASFNFDTTLSTTAGITADKTHLSSQQYDICIRRKRNFCQICFDPNIVGATATTNPSSFGIGASSAATIQTSSIGSVCAGNTIVSATEANNRAGDYLTIMNLQTSTAAIAAIAGAIGVNQLCGGIVAGSATIAQGTICSFTTPFKVGVNFDSEEAVFTPVMAANIDKFDVTDAVANGAGRGYLGFYLNYWQVAC